MSLCHPLVTPTEILLIIRALSLYSEDAAENADFETMRKVSKLIGMLSHEISADELKD